MFNLKHKHTYELMFIMKFAGWDDIRHLQERKNNNECKIMQNTRWNCVISCWFKLLCMVINVVCHAACRVTNDKRCGAAIRKKKTILLFYYFPSISYISNSRKKWKFSRKSTLFYCKIKFRISLLRFKCLWQQVAQKKLKNTRVEFIWNKLH